MPSFIDKTLREKEPHETLEMQHKRDQTSVCKRNVHTNPFQGLAQGTSSQAKAAQVGFGNGI